MRRGSRVQVTARAALAQKASGSAMLALNRSWYRPIPRTVARARFPIVRFMTSEPPPIPGVRRSFVEARGVRFHVTESGPPDGRPVLALHGWPQHHWAYHDLLADPPPGM